MAAVLVLAGACSDDGGPTVATRPDETSEQRGEPADATPETGERTEPVGPPPSLLATPTPTPENIFVHTVESGETLVVIAERFGVTVEEIIAVNSLIDPNVLQVGDQVNVPEPPG